MSSSIGAYRDNKDYNLAIRTNLKLLEANSCVFLHRS